MSELHPRTADNVVAALNGDVLELALHSERHRAFDDYLRQRGDLAAAEKDACTYTRLMRQRERIHASHQGERS